MMQSCANSSFSGQAGRCSSNPSGAAQSLWFSSVGTSEYMCEPFIHDLDDIRVELCSKTQIPLGAFETFVSEVSRQIRKGNGEIDGASYPAFQAMNGKRMTKVMNTWSFTTAAVRNAGFPDKSPEVIIDSFFGVSTAVGGRKKRLFRGLHGVH